MKIPVTVIGFALVVIGRTIFGYLRADYLRRASEEVSIDASNKIVLRHALWDYIFAIILFAGSVFMGWEAFHETAHPEAILIYKVACVFCFFGGIFLSYLEYTGRITIFDGKLIYKEGPDKRIIHADEVFKVWLSGFAIMVKLKSEKVVRIPATFEHSEVILAFLKQAAAVK